jgi:2-dehydropantoate 2-reductase
MRIAVMAAGAVGGYFGGRLADSGNDVHFIARGRHLEALRRHGLRIESPLGDLHLADVQAVDSPAAIGPVDVVLFAVKLWDSEAAADSCRPLIGPETAVITLQNGIGGAARIAPVIGAEHAVGGAAYIASVLAEPGLVRHGGEIARLVFGETDGGESPRLSAFLDACGMAGFDATLSRDIERDQWEKFVFLAGLSGITGLTREPIGPSLDDADRRAFFHDLMKEVVAVGRAEGVALDPEFADDRLSFAETVPATMRASMLEDLERGNRLELDWLAGEVVRRGRALGVPTPANAAVHVGLKAFADGRDRAS